MSLPELTKQEILRYSRHLIMPEVTLEGQRKLKAASVLCIGTGGLGSPMTMYLAAAGVGKLGLVDFDVVDFTNLQRQIIFGESDVGQSKVSSGIKRLTEINPGVNYVAHETHLSSENAMEIFEDYDIIADGTDNFPTRYLVNDACVLSGKPNVYGSIFRFDGQLSVFDAKTGPCYRCLYPDPPPPGLVPSCAEGGVLGVLPGIIGCMQAMEVIKLILGAGDSMSGRLLMFDAMGMTFKTLKIRKDPKCPICGENATIKELIDYEQFCGIRGEESDTIIGMDRMPEMTVRQLKDKLDKEAGTFELIDVREPQEYQLCNLAEAKLIPLGELPGRLHELDSSKEYVVHCKMGGRSAQAVQLMQQAGFAKVHNLTGGITAWAQEIDTSMPTY
jgi:adenylyltransferase/sulfurtransferase